MSTPAPATIHSITSRRRRGERQAGQSDSATVPKVAPIKWIDAFETGNAEIDDLHRKLVEACNSLQKFLADGAAWSLIVAQTKKLAVDCIEHFQVEQAVLERIDFPRRAAHQVEHGRMEQELRALIARIDEFDGSLNEHRQLPATLIPALIDLMIRHDLDYRSHILYCQGR